MTLTKRTFLAAALPAALACTGAVRLGKMRKIGLQLYTVREAFAADPIGTLNKIAAAGYEEFEFAGPIDTDFIRLRDRMRAIGLACPSAHFAYDDWRNKRELAFRAAKRLGARTMVLAWTPPEARASLADWTTLAKFCNEAAADAHAHGFRFAYHNHNFEFEPMEGQVPFELLLATFNKALVKLEIDVYWAKKGGVDPVALIERLGHRVTMLHLKDMAADGSMADFGAGTMDFRAILRVARNADVEHYFIERDDAPAPYWPSVEASIANARKLSF